MTSVRSRYGIDYDELVKDDRVHGDVYLRPEIFEEELEKIWHRGWVYVGHAGEIPQPGDYRLSTIGSQPVIMTRDEDGQMRLLLNRCRHRANAVCQAERGNAHYFRCAYHGWTYANDGRLVGVTYQNGYPDCFRKEEYGLTPVPRVADYRGFVFGSMSASGISLDEHLGLAKEQLDLFCDLAPDGELEVRAGVHKYAYNANWKFQLENGMDGYHPNFTHQSFFDALAKRTGRKLALYTGDSNGLTRDLGNGHTMLDARPFNRANPANAARRSGADPSTTWGRAYAEAMERRYGKARADEVLTAGGTHMAVFPNLILINAQIRVIRPISVDRTEVFLYPALLKGAPQEINTARLRYHESFYGPAGGGAPDDLEMFERNQMGLQATLDPWLIVSRGMQREYRDADGSIVGQMTDEVPQRGIFRHWKRVMTSG